MSVTTCPLCEATCGLEVTVDAGRVTKIRGDADDVFSRGFVCPKGGTLAALHDDPDRLRAPLVQATGGGLDVRDEPVGPRPGRGPQTSSQIEPLSGTAVLNGIPVDIAPAGVAVEA